jgi:hypothetical protein
MDVPRRGTSIDNVGSHALIAFAAGHPGRAPCILATQQLHRTFVSLLQKLGFSPSDVASATLTFTAPGHARDDYTLPCRSKLVTADGTKYEHELA